MEKLILKCGPLVADLAQRFLRANIPWWPF